MMHSLTILKKTKLSNRKDPNRGLFRDRMPP
jgi:hypothetical protein